MAAEDVLHDLGVISMYSSDSQAMGRIGEARSKRKQIALDLFEHRRQSHGVLRVAVGQRLPCESEPGIQLVDLAVGRHPSVRLRHPGSVEEARLACISGPGVDFHGTIIRKSEV